MCPALTCAAPLSPVWYDSPPPQSASRSSPPAPKRVLFNLGSSSSLGQNHTHTTESHQVTNHTQPATADGPTGIEIETDDEKCELKQQLLLVESCLIPSPLPPSLPPSFSPPLPPSLPSLPPSFSPSLPPSLPSLPSLPFPFSSPSSHTRAQPSSGPGTPSRLL